jgi:hypothetical protein
VVRTANESDWQRTYSGVAGAEVHHQRASGRDQSTFGRGLIRGRAVLRIDKGCCAESYEDKPRE